MVQCSTVRALSMATVIGQFPAPAPRTQAVLVLQSHERSTATVGALHRGCAEGWAVGMQESCSLNMCW